MGSTIGTGQCGRDDRCTLPPHLDRDPCEIPAVPDRTVEALIAHRPSRWRSFTNDNEILRCCGLDFGNATRKCKRGDDELAWAQWAEHAARAAAPDALRVRVEALAACIEDPRTQRPGMQRRRIWAQKLRALLEETP